MRQANKLADAMKDVPLSAAWTSDLKRARDVSWLCFCFDDKFVLMYDAPPPQTAEIVMKHHTNAPFTVDKGLRERVSL